MVTSRYLWSRLPSKLNLQRLSVWSALTQCRQVLRWWRAMIMPTIVRGFSTTARIY